MGRNTGNKLVTAWVTHMTLSQTTVKNYLEVTHQNQAGTGMTGMEKWQMLLIQIVIKNSLGEVTELIPLWDGDDDLNKNFSIIFSE